MKILITFFDINNLGGIINHTEQLIYGLKEIGHEVEMAQLLHKKTVSGTRCRDLSKFSDGALLPVSQSSGWLWPKENRWAYEGEENLKKWLEYTSKFDVVLWQTPVPTKQQDNKGNMDWVNLYGGSALNFAVIHDGNFQKAIPHINYVKEHFSGLICVHPCAYHGSQIDIPKTMIFNPQEIDMMKVIQLQSTWSERKTGFIAPQTFKAWKHVDDLIFAIPYAKVSQKLVAGGGIEHCYLTSKYKCKPQYMYEDGSRAWDVALQYGMEFLGYLTAPEVTERLQTLRTLVDPSWSINYSSVGDHFNRVVVDAMINGCVPIARNLGMSTNIQGVGEVFQPDTHYSMVPYDASPEEFGNIITETNNLSKEKLDVFHKNACRLLPHFERKAVAEQYIKMFNGEETGWYNKTEVSVLSTKVEKNSEKTMREFFNKGVN
jgi:glycosyltransferase involved in cell wall biosynthesis